LADGEGLAIQPQFSVIGAQNRSMKAGCSHAAAKPKNKAAHIGSQQKCNGSRGLPEACVVVLGVSDVF
jgi:hypothetical protein